MQKFGAFILQYLLGSLLFFRPLSKSLQPTYFHSIILIEIPIIKIIEIKNKARN